MKRLSLLILLPAWVLFGCGEDDPILTPLVCEGGSDFAVDFRPTSWANNNRLWVTDLDQKMEFGQTASVAVNTLSFVNFPDACESVYNLNYAYTQGLATNDNFLELRVDEFAEIPSGSIVDVGARTSGFYQFQAVGDGEEIRIENCPSVDSVRFLTPVTNEVDGVFVPFFTYEYRSSDGVLLLKTELTFANTGDFLLAINTGEPDEWVGQLINIGQPLPAVIDYNDLAPLDLQRTQVNWPVDAENLALEARIITNAQTQRTVLLGRLNERTELNFPRPNTSLGPFLVRARWKAGDQEFAWSRVFEELPVEITIDSPIDLRSFDFSYPTLQLNTSGAEIITFSGSYLIPNEISSKRAYYGPLTEGAQTIRLGTLSSELSTPETERLFELGLSEQRNCRLYYYHNMNGNYRWYLRNVLSDRATGNTWLQTLDYDQVWFPF